MRSPCWPAGVALSSSTKERRDAGQASSEMDIRELQAGGNKMGYARAAKVRSAAVKESPHM